jgi:hypothetical protein
MPRTLAAVSAGAASLRKTMPRTLAATSGHTVSLVASKTVFKTLNAVSSGLALLGFHTTTVVHDITDARLEAALNGTYGPPSYRFRFERRTIANQFLEDVSAAFPTDVEATIDASNDRTVFRVAKLTVDPDEVDRHIDYLADHIAVFLDIVVREPGAPDQTFPIQCGLFALSAPQITKSANGNERWVISASDTVIHLVEATTTSTYTIAAGQNYITGTNAAKAICDAFGIPNVLGTTSLTLPSTQTWPPGTPYATILNWCLTGCGFYSAKADRYGVIRSRPNMDASQRPADVTYTDVTWLTGDIVENIDTTRFANQIIAMRNDPSGGLLVSVATNDDPDSPISTVTLGRTISKPMNFDNAADQTTLDGLALNALRDASYAYRTTDIQTQLDPRREAFEVYALTDALGGYEADLWLARKWSFSLRTQPPTGVMKHTVSKISKLVPS